MNFASEIHFNRKLDIVLFMLVFNLANNYFDYEYRLYDFAFCFKLFTHILRSLNDHYIYFWKTHAKCCSNKLYYILVN